MQEKQKHDSLNAMQCASNTELGNKWKSLDPPPMINLDAQDVACVSDGKTNHFNTALDIKLPTIRLKLNLPWFMTTDPECLCMYLLTSMIVMGRDIEMESS